MPLGHMLTFKVAYQIAAGLGYLHRKSIIFCDLKSDNILVWSLEVCKMLCFLSILIYINLHESKRFIQVIFFFLSFLKKSELR